MFSRAWAGLVTPLVIFCSNGSVVDGVLDYMPEMRILIPMSYTYIPADGRDFAPGAALPSLSQVSGYKIQLKA